jgi:hypothetical protein
MAEQFAVAERHRLWHSRPSYRCCGVPQVGSSCRGFHSSPLKGSSHNIGNAVAGYELSDWSTIAEEDPIRADISRPKTNVTEQCIANVLRQRQADLIPAFTGYSQSAVHPIYIIEAKQSQVTSADAQSAQHQNNRSVANTCNSIAPRSIWPFEPIPNPQKASDSIFRTVIALLTHNLRYKR